jgi:hypothetical protein
MGGKFLMQYDMQDNLVFSKGAAQNSDTATLMAMIPGCVGVSEAMEAADRNGVDYIATLRRGARIFIDAKARRRGCSKFWRKLSNGKPEPEVALEKWSVLPGGKYRKKEGRVGWTLCEAKQTDLILYTFDHEDCRDVFIFPFQLLRIAFKANIAAWYSTCKVDVQDSGRWQSEAVFVPVGLVFSAIRRVSQSTVMRSAGGEVELQYQFNF